MQCNWSATLLRRAAPHRTKNLHVCLSWDAIYTKILFTLSSEKDKNRNGFYDRNRDSVLCVWSHSDVVGSLRGRGPSTMNEMSQSRWVHSLVVVFHIIFDSFGKHSNPLTLRRQRGSNNQPYRPPWLHNERVDTEGGDLHVSVSVREFFWCLLHTPCGRQIILFYS